MITEQYTRDMSWRLEGMPAEGGRCREGGWGEPARPASPNTAVEARDRCSHHGFDMLQAEIVSRLGPITLNSSAPFYVQYMSVPRWEKKVGTSP